MARLLNLATRGWPAALILIIVNIFAWYPALNFWFFRAWEPGWLIGVCGQKFNFLCLLRSHGVLYLLNYKLFGWNPTGWYLTAIILHIVAVLLVFQVAKILFRQNIIAFIAALLFGVNVTYHDVINWGSFEGLYALLLVIFLLAVVFYQKFQEAKKRRFLWYLAAVALFLFGLFIREVGLALPFFLLFFELYTKSFRLSKKYLVSLFKIFFPFAVISLGYLILRQYYGGAPHDFIDAMVQLRITLLSQGLYLEYIWRGILSFGRFAAAHVIPYPLLNDTRQFLTQSFYPPRVYYYFFSLVGFFYVGAQTLVIWKLRQDKIVRNLLLFSFLWFLTPTVFYSFAFSITDDALVKEYVWDASRWRYFAFLGTVIFWLTVFGKIYETLTKRFPKLRRKIAGLFMALILFVLGTNFYYLRAIQSDMYVNDFKPAKLFYTTLLANFPTLPSDYVFYHYPAAQRLNDYLSELYFLRQVYYPNLTQERGREFAETVLGMVIERFTGGTADPQSTYFLDFNEKVGVINKTKEAKGLIFGEGQKERSISVGKKAPVTLILAPPLPVEVPYKVEVSLRGTPAQATAALGQKQEETLEAFAQDLIQFSKNAKVSVCGTAPIGSRGAPAPHLLPQNLVDGNFGGRSTWTANCRPAWVIIDLGRKLEVGAVAFHGRDGPAVPSDYTISVSGDGQRWQEVASARLNTELQRIEKFSPVLARFVKLDVSQTTRGGMLELDEVAVLGENSLPAVSLYGHDFERLVTDSRQVSPYMVFSWKTEPSDSDPNKKIFTPISADGNVRTYTIWPNESEVYSNPGEFLKRFISQVSLESSGPSQIEVLSVKIVPKFKLKTS